MTALHLTLPVLAVALGLSACGAPPQSPDTVRMSLLEGGQAITGTYNTSGFSQAQVRQMVGRICTNAGFSGFNQSTNGDVASFSASCAAPTIYINGADARFVAQDDNTVDFFINYSQNGRPLETGGNFAI